MHLDYKFHASWMVSYTLVNTQHQNLNHPNDKFSIKTPPTLYYETAAAHIVSQCESAIVLQSRHVLQWLIKMHDSCFSLNSNTEESFSFEGAFNILTC